LYRLVLNRLNRMHLYSFYKGTPVQERIGDCREFFLCIFLVLITSFCREYDHLSVTLNRQFNVIKPSISDVSNSQ